MKRTLDLEGFRGSQARTSTHVAPLAPRSASPVVEVPRNEASKPAERPLAQ